jgi:hypothetical protein
VRRMTILPATESGHAGGVQMWIGTYGCFVLSLFEFVRVRKGLSRKRFVDC